MEVGYWIWLLVAFIVGMAVTKIVKYVEDKGAERKTVKNIYEIYRQSEETNRIAGLFEARKWGRGQ